MATGAASKSETNLLNQHLLRLSQRGVHNVLGDRKRRLITELNKADVYLRRSCLLALNSAGGPSLLGGGAAKHLADMEVKG